MAKWSIEEIWVKSQESNGYMDITTGLNGARNAHENEWMSIYLEYAVERACIAEYVPLLKDAVFVSLPHTDGDGKPVSDDAYQGLLEGAAGEGTLIATVSGEKSGNYVRVSKDAWAQIAAPFGPTEGVKAMQAASLLFSSCTPGTARIVDAEIIWPGHPLDDGQDGNGMAPKDALPCTCQGRGAHIIQITHNAEADPSRMVKGIFAPVSPDGKWYIHHTQLKGAWGGETHARVVLMFNEAVASEHIERNQETGAVRTYMRQSYMSSEVSALLKDTKSIRRECALRVRDETWKVVSLLQQDHKIEFLERCGVLSKGYLRAPKSAGEDLMLTPLPMCREAEKVLGRFMAPEIVSIAHGLGIRVTATIAVISERYGVAPITYEEAMLRKATGKKVWCMYRVPVNGAGSLIWLDKNPYKRGLGAVVSPSAMKQADGDADGDTVFILSPSDSADVLGWLDTRIQGGHKPEKRAKPGFDPRCLESVHQHWCDLLPTHSLVGRATLLGWRAIRDGRFGDASEALTAANAAPMLAKWDVRIGETPLATAISTLAEVEKAASPKDDEGQAQVRQLRWRQFKDFAKGCALVRDLGDWACPRAESLLDVVSNAAAMAVRRWSKENPSYPMPIKRLGRLVYAAMDDPVLPGWAVRDAARIRQQWREYWQGHRDEKGILDDADHRTIFKIVREWAATADKFALAALIAHEPGELETTTLRFIVFDVHRGTEVLGFDPRVLAYLKAHELYREHEQAIRAGLLKFVAAKVLVEKYGKEAQAE